MHIRKTILCLAAAGSLLLAGCNTESKKRLEEKIGEGYTETMDTRGTITEISTDFWKQADHTTLLSGEIFCADPTAVEYNGRLYVFGTNDHQQYDAVGNEGSNTYDKITSLVIFSTDDMVNWTYHGDIDVKAVAPWIINSWAPSIVSRVEEDGKTHFYLYFSNNGCGVGVIHATDPLGPWDDPLGEPLVYQNMKGIGDCPNPFDPGVVIDENGVGWLSFGAGTARTGSAYQPGATRIVQLGEDMTSFASEFKRIPAPYAFEASELNYINGTYIYTYCNSWEGRLEWDYPGVDRPGACSMSYMTTKTPLDPDSWEYRGDYLSNPGENGFAYSNNHSHLHKFGDKYYLFHHSLQKQMLMPTEGGFRSLNVIELGVNEETVTFNTANPSRTGVTQVKSVDASAVNQGESFFTSTNAAFEMDGTAVLGVKSQKAGTVVCVKGVEFSKDASSAFTAVIKGTGRVEIRLDDPASEAIAAIEADSRNFEKLYDEIKKQSGVHDVYIVFSDADMVLDHWQFV